MVGVRKTGFDMFQLRFDLHHHEGNFIAALLTMLYVDMIDCTATLQGLARYTYRLQGLDPDFPGSTIAYCTNAFCISMGALLGSSPVTVYVESGAGAQSGGRTGIAAIVTGLCFLSAVFLAPFFSGIPPYATGPALILVRIIFPLKVYCTDGRGVDRFPDVAANWQHQLELCWRRHSLLCHDHVHSF